MARVEQSVRQLADPICVYQQGIKGVCGFCGFCGGMLESPAAATAVDDFFRARYPLGSQVS